MVECIFGIIAMFLKDGNKIVEDDYSNVERLEEDGLISQENANILSEANGLRNLLVHRYNKVDYQFNITLYHVPPLDEIPKARIEGKVKFVLLNVPIEGAIVEAYPILSEVESYVPVTVGTKTRERGEFSPPVPCLNTLRLEDGRVI